MSSVLGFLSAAFWGLVVLSVLVFVHEGGHYLAARAFHVRATEFFLGLPFRWKLSRKSAKVGTEFGVTPLLLGGDSLLFGGIPVRSTVFQQTDFVFNRSKESLFQFTDCLMSFTGLFFRLGKTFLHLFFKCLQTADMIICRHIGFLINDNDFRF